MALNKDKSILASSSSDTVTLWDLQAGENIHTFTVTYSVIA